MSKQSEAVKKWRHTTKKRIIESMGGECQICKYSKCDKAMDLHHIDPNEKEIGLASIRANPKKWETIVKELRKCVLLCNRCHQELHAGVTELPKEYKSFNEEYADYRKLEKLQKMNDCPICGKLKPVMNITCSRSCAAKKAGKVDWDNIDLENLLKHNTFTATAEILGISDGGVRKRAKKIGLI